MNMPHPTLARASEAAENLADRAAVRAEDAIAATREATANTLDKLQAGVERLHEKSPSAISRAAAHVDDFTQRLGERARETTAHARERAHEAGDRAVAHVRDEPVRSVLMAVAAGAALAALVSYVATRRSVPPRF